MAETPISEIIKTALEGVKQTLDANTVMGEPMTVLEHTVIVPISKISCGIATGGSDFGGKKEAAKKNFGGGGGTGITVMPIAFLVVTSDGNVKILNVGENTGYASSKVADALAAADNVIEKAPDMISKILDIFKKKTDMPENEAANQADRDAVSSDSDDSK